MLRNRNFYDKKFLRQHPIFFEDISGKECFYIADIYCHEYRFVIEIDGKSHDYRLEYDNIRTKIMSGSEITVLRFQNDEIENDLAAVLEKIKTRFSS